MSTLNVSVDNYKCKYHCIYCSNVNRMLINHSNVCVKYMNQYATKEFKRTNKLSFNDQVPFGPSNKNGWLNNPFL